MTSGYTPNGSRSGRAGGGACVLESPAGEGAGADFVDQGSIVRRIWGDGDMVLLVFAGSAAEFALNRAVDWLFFTGKLPADPIGRLFSTAGYAQGIVFADAATAARTLARIRAVHQAVERERGQQIPDWAHRDVLYMLIDYSERAHETFARPLTADEQHELYDVFHRVGIGLGIPDLPPTYAEWRADRERHLRRDLVHGEGTKALYAQYRKHLGQWRYHLLLRLQSILTPEHVRGLLRMKRAAWLRPLVRLYPVLVRAGLRSLIQWLLMPSAYLPAVRALDQPMPGPPEPRIAHAGDVACAGAT
jgi:uncharacterized protein (DUF2236 family)